MVGLSVVLEAHNSHTPSSTHAVTKKTVMPLVICKPAVVKPPPPSASAGQNFHLVPRRPLGGGFLDVCFLCRQSLLPGKDIYMYKGDKAFCSEECRWKQMLMDDSDEQDNTTATTTTNASSRRKEVVRDSYNHNDNCSLAATKPTLARHHRNPFAR